MISFFDARVFREDSHNAFAFIVRDKLMTLVTVTGRKRLPMNDLDVEFFYGVALPMGKGQLRSQPSKPSLDYADNLR